LWATARSRSLLTVLKRTMGLWEPGLESGSQVLEWDNLGEFPGVVEIAKPQNVTKTFGQVDESCVGETAKHNR